ncbi:ABC transporter permease [Gordonia sp. NPDC003424]
MSGPSEAAGVIGTDDAAHALDAFAADVTPHRTSVPLTVSVATLGREKLRGALRSGDLTMAALSSMVFFVCFYTPLHRRFELTGGDYAQFLTPIIALQAGLFTAIAATEAAGADARAGVRERLASLPMSRISPQLARMVWVLARLTVAMSACVAMGAALGFRFHGTWWQTIAFLVLVMLVGLGLSMLTDAAGTVARNATGVAYLLMIPQLILVMASTGLVPADAFPGWAQPFVRNQPMSVFADALRALAAGADVPTAAPVLWLVGLLGAGWLAMLCAARRSVGR